MALPPAVAPVARRSRRRPGAGPSSWSRTPRRWSPRPRRPRRASGSGRRRRRRSCGRGSSGKRPSCADRRPAGCRRGVGSRTPSAREGPPGPPGPGPGTGGPRRSEPSPSRPPSPGSSSPLPSCRPPLGGLKVGRVCHDGSSTPCHMAPTIVNSCESSCLDEGRRSDTRDPRHTGLSAEPGEIRIARHERQLRRTVSRRQFASTSALAALSAAVVPRRVLGAQAPSNKLNIAAIGVGGMGTANLKACEGENIVALCDVDSAYAAKTFAPVPEGQGLQGLPGDAREGEGHRRGDRSRRRTTPTPSSRWPSCRRASTCSARSR